MMAIAAGRRPLWRRVARDEEAVAVVVEAHRVATEESDSGIAGDAAQPLRQRRLNIWHGQAAEDDRGQHGAIDRFGQIRQRGVARHPVDFRAAKVDGVDGACKATVQRLAEEGVAERARRATGADDGDRLCSQEAIERG
jgi:hypothetical protein